MTKPDDIPRPHPIVSAYVEARTRERRLNGREGLLDSLQVTAEELESVWDEYEGLLADLEDHQWER